MAKIKTSKKTSTRTAAQTSALAQARCDSRKSAALDRELIAAGVSRTTGPGGEFCWFIKRDTPEVRALVARANEARHAGWFK